MAPVADDLFAWRPNPADADWDAMAQRRNRLPDSTTVELWPSYEFGAQGRLRELNRAVGYARSVPDPHLGPRLVLSAPYRHRNGPTAKRRYTYMPFVSLLTVTAKMGCFSFSMPAGPASRGGTCPLAQRHTTERTRSAVPEVDRQFGHADATAADYLCNGCYAGKNDYLTYPLTAIRQEVRRRWVLKALKEGPGFLAQQLVEAIQYTQLIPPARLAAKNVNPRYFRIHDSGDFWRIDYWREWLAVARHFYRERGRSRVWIWAPVRMWASPAWRDEFAASDIPDNFVVRPSALFFEAPAPRVRDSQGLAAGTTASAAPMGSLRVFSQAMARPYPGPALGVPAPGEEHKRRPRRLFPERRVPKVSADEVWDCPAYLGDSKKTKSCIAQDCRVCWTRPDVEVSYHEH